MTKKNNYQIREILQSSKIYLVFFGDGVFQSIQEGITVDSTIVTADNTAITIDSSPVTAANIGFYSKYTQVPVTLTTDSLLIKTRLNDKSSISYSLDFEATNNTINDIM